MRFLRRSLPPIVIVPAIAAAACTAATGNQAYSIMAGGYRDHAGWSVAYPRTWHIVHFQAANSKARAAGIQLSNVRLPRPDLVPGAPIQVSGKMLPGRGIGLIIAQDSDRRLDRSNVAKPPLRYPEGWLTGSAPAGSPYIQEQWFRVHGVLLLATVKIAPGATQHDLAALAAILRSIRLVPPTSG